MSVLTPFLDIDKFVKALKGRSKGLRPSKPGGDASKAGLMQYVWRMVRFHAGHDTTMPMNCRFYLQDWSDEQFGKGVVNFLYMSNANPDYAEQKTLYNELEVFVDQIIDALGESRYEAAKRYRGLLY